VKNVKGEAAIPSAGKGRFLMARPGGGGKKRYRGRRKGERKDPPGITWETGEGRARGTFHLLKGGKRALRFLTLEVREKGRKTRRKGEYKRRSKERGAREGGPGRSGGESTCLGMKEETSSCLIRHLTGLTGKGGRDYSFFARKGRE